MPIDIKQIGKNVPAPPPEAPKATRPDDVRVATERLALEEERIYRKGVVTVRDIISPGSFEKTVS